MVIDEWSDHLTRRKKKKGPINWGFGCIPKACFFFFLLFIYIIFFFFFFKLIITFCSKIFHIRVKEKEKKRDKRKKKKPLLAPSPLIEDEEASKASLKNYAKPWELGLGFRPFTINN